jgi:hypothetical protein
MHAINVTIVAIESGRLNRAQEIAMRIGFLALAVLAATTIPMAGPALARDYPVCMRVYEGMSYHTDQCDFMTMAQCNASASGRPAQCMVNSFYAGPRSGQPSRKRHRRAR